MSPRIRLVLLTILSVVVGIAVGIDIANESYGWAFVTGLVCAWLIVKRLSDARPDAWLLAVAIVGYVVGNRGFAQLQPSPLIPLLPAEAVLLAAVPALIVRAAFKESAGFRRDVLNYSVLFWIVLGTIRLPLDMRDYGVMALRDYAMIYYAVFFFIAQEFGGHEGSMRLLRSSITISFVALLPVVVSILIAPDFLADNLTWRGTPLIYHKSDLIATSLAAGFFWLWTRWGKSRHRRWLVGSATSLLLIAAMASPRAGMLAVAIVSLLWLFTGRWQITAALIGIVGAASVVSVGVIGFSGKDLKTSIPYSMYEHALSIFDPAGTGTYINGASGDPGLNNRFRWVWWQDVVEDTMAINPMFGLGFGSDLSARFLADYDPLSDENFSARSPHSIIVTVIGRMGIVGLAAWMAISASIAATVWRLLKRGEPDGMGLASIVTVIWLSASFGVVLEGPMGAVIFWSALGLAQARLREPLSALGTVEREAALQQWPVAKPLPADTQSSTR